MSWVASRLSTARCKTCSPQSLPCPVFPLVPMWRKRLHLQLPTRKRWLSKDTCCHSGRERPGDWSAVLEGVRGELWMEGVDVVYVVYSPRTEVLGYYWEG